jgi:hypothetical protein
VNQQGEPSLGNDPVNVTRELVTAAAEELWEGVFPTRSAATAKPHYNRATAKRHIFSADRSESITSQS